MARRLLWPLLVGIAAMASPPAWAEPGDPAQSSPPADPLAQIIAQSAGQPAAPVVPAAPALAPVAAAGPFGATHAVDGSALGSITGMADLQLFANANNNSIVAGNSVNGHSVTGQIAIDGQSFQNMNGLSILTANTGNNVSINAAMNVNVSIQQ